MREKGAAWLKRINRTVSYFNRRKRAAAIAAGVLATALFLQLFYTLSANLEKSLTERDALRQQVLLAEAQKTEWEHAQATNEQLPELAAYLERVLEGKNLSIGEIVITQAAGNASGNPGQATIKISAGGREDDFLQALDEIQEKRPFQFLIQEIESDGSAFRITLNVSVR